MTRNRRRRRGAPLSAVCTVLLVTAIGACSPGGSAEDTPAAGTTAPSPRSDVSVELIVNVPADTPPDAVVHVAGSLPQLGGVWRPDGVPLARRDDGTWRARLAFPRGATLQYKFTLGSWQTVERDAAGKDIANRRLPLDGDRAVRLVVEGWASGAPQPREHTLTGDVRFHENFESRILGNRRTIAVYLPPGYDGAAAAAGERYPVLYMHDGQNVFDDATSFAGEWRADETAERLISEGRIRPLIIVGVANAGDARADEYTPSPDARYGGEGGRAPEYARFLLEEVKPFVDRTYRTLPDRDNTGVCGSSLGGLVSLFIAAEHPDKVGLCGAVSPSLWWNEREMVQRVRRDPAWTRNCRVWLDMGTSEGEEGARRNIAETRELAMILQGAGRRPGKDFKYLEVPGGEHNEPAWAARFDQVLLFLFGKR